MPFPSSFETDAAIWLHKDDKLDEAEVATRIADALAADGATVLNRDANYFEFRSPFMQTLMGKPVQAVVRAGNITTQLREKSIAVNAEVHVRVLPQLIVMGAFGVLQIIGVIPTVGTVIGLIVTGYTTISLYSRARTRFRQFIDSVCASMKGTPDGAPKS